MARTYEPIASVTTASSAATVTFDNIPGTYTDIVWVVHHGLSSDQVVGLRFNNDSGSNYSTTRLTGNGSAAASGRVSSETYIRALSFGVANASTIQNVTVGHVLSYANTNVNKTTLEAQANASSGVSRCVGLWRSTNAITRIDFVAQSSATFVNGSTVSLYGIKAT